MAITVVQFKDANGSGTSMAVSFDATPTAGNAVLVAVRHFTGTNGMAVTDNQGNIYAPDATVTDAQGQSTRTYHCFSVAASGTFTVTLTPDSSDFMSVGIMEVSGGISSTDTSHTSTGADAAPNSGAATPSSATGIAMGAAAINSAPGAFATADSPFTMMSTVDASTRLLWSYHVLSDTSAQTASWAIEFARTWGAVIVNYQGGAAATTRARPMIRMSR